MVHEVAAPLPSSGGEVDGADANSTRDRTARNSDELVRIRRKPVPECHAGGV
jgi:hypothetical protein